MTIDERLDRLTERHDALAKSVEMLTKDIAALQRLEAQVTEHIRALLQRERLLRGEGGETQ